MKDIKKVFGTIIRELRLAQGFSQERLAEVARLHRNYVGGVERGERNISIVNIQKISFALKTTISDIFKQMEKK